MSATPHAGRTIAEYALSNVFRQGLGIVSAVVRPMLLSPELYGLWNLLKTIPPYASFAHLGARPAARYRIPYNAGGGADAENTRIEDTIFVGSLLTNLPIVIGASAWAFIGESTPEARWGMLTVAAWILLNWYHEHLLTLQKAHQGFRAISAANYVISLAMFCLLPLILVMSIYGLYASMLLATAAGTLILRRDLRRSQRPRFDFRLYADLVRHGLPIMLFTLTVLAARTCDRFLIASLIGTRELGYYGIATMILTFIMNIPTATREVMEPQLMRDLHVADEDTALRDYLFRPLFTTAYAMPLILAPVFTLAPTAVRLLLPQYVPGIPSVHILAAGSFFLGLIYITRGIVVARGWQTSAAIVGGCAVALNIALSAGLVRAGFGIEGVAVGASVGYVLFFWGICRLMHTRSNGHIRGWTRTMIATTIPFVVMVASAACVIALMDASGLPALVAPVLGLCVYGAVNVGTVMVARRLYPELSDFTIRALLGRGEKEKVRHDHQRLR
ncbi:O-antigen/teichoic acid export membrane protein [Desulfobaculum xiamenense]|uniref:O-antigen/teichoic acid export membrane protein n=1 Tax=Desulfobaculum xiamenense TaxID=995050 RepID=A0A846QH92_9BACT|nr:oligosaccharide flippase family protein [Desulfobaculum xiamenense]NJB67648.1 O-antigen/teichoic acid export membrane protein [Desulfobaculum xiamenense]